AGGCRPAVDERERLAAGRGAARAGRGGGDRGRGAAAGGGRGRRPGAGAAGGRGTITAADGEAVGGVGGPRRPSPPTPTLPHQGGGGKHALALSPYRTSPRCRR